MVLRGFLTLDQIQLLWLWKISSMKWQEIPTKSPMAPCSLLLCHRQDFLNYHLWRVPITPNQQGTMEKRDEVFSSVGAQDMDTSGFEVSDRGDVELYWEKYQLDIDADFRPSTDTPFSLLILTVLRSVAWLKTRFWLTKFRTRRNFFLLTQQLQFPRNQPNPLCWWDSE